MKNFLKSLEPKHWILLIGALIIAWKLFNPDICEFRRHCTPGIETSQTILKVIALSLITSVAYFLIGRIKVNRTGDNSTKQE